MIKYRYEVTASRLRGCVNISGSKNAVLPILAATLMNKSVSYIDNCPSLSDLDVAVNILQSFGCIVEKNGKVIMVDATRAYYQKVPEDLVSKCRASLAFLGSSIARFGEAELTLPGGCVLGPRPIDMHVDMMRLLGLEVMELDRIIVQGKILDSDISLPYPSVGVTENIMMMAAAKDCTVCIRNAAKEPEIVNLAAYLTALGANIKGAGTGRITIKGCCLTPRQVHISIIPDRIEAATYLIAGALSGRDVTVLECFPTHMKKLLTILHNMGCNIEIGKNHVRLINGRLDKQLKPPLYIEARPYPCFPTDMQPLIVAMLSVITSQKSPTIVADTVFPDRFALCAELEKMGANIQMLKGGCLLEGLKYDSFIPAKDLVSHDLRAGAALILASLCCEEGSVCHIYDGGFIERGYENISEKFSQIGGKISLKLIQ